MRRPTRGRLLLAASVGLLVILTGCGSPAPETPPGPFPPRPVTIDLSTLDLCSGVTPAEADRLKLPPVSRSTTTVEGSASPTCDWTDPGFGTFAYTAQAIPLSTIGAEQVPGSKIIEIEGFGAVQNVPETVNTSSSPAFCQIAVDVAADQTLRIQVENGVLGTGNDQAALDATCAEARRFATEFLTTLRS